MLIRCLFAAVTLWGWSLGAYADTVYIPVTANCDGDPTPTACRTELNAAIASRVAADTPAGLSCSLDGYWSASTQFPYYYSQSSPPQWPGVYLVCAGEQITLPKLYKPGSACAAKLNQPVSGMIERGTESIPPQQVCVDSCQYSLAQAQPVTGLDGIKYWSGTWVGDGVSCSGNTTTNPADTPTAEGSATKEAGKAADEAQKAKEDALAEMLAKSLAQRPNNSSERGKSPLGEWFALPQPIRDLLVPSPSANCQSGPVIPEGSAFLQPIRNALQGKDWCQIQSIADTFGNWFIWFCAILWSWSMVTRGSAE